MYIKNIRITFRLIEIYTITTTTKYIIIYNTTTTKYILFPPSVYKKYNN